MNVNNKKVWEEPKQKKMRRETIIKINQRKIYD